MGDYLSARLIKTAELDPQGRYLFAAYPHGISAISGWVCFATEAAGFSKLFPGWLQQQHHYCGGGRDSRVCGRCALQCKLAACAMLGSWSCMQFVKQLLLLLLQGCCCY
jgi:hypothetical protein